jgi:hypothetical protein
MRGSFAGQVHGLARKNRAKGRFHPLVERRFPDK